MIVTDLPEASKEMDAMVAEASPPSNSSWPTAAS
jgi:hypothetical protein